MRDVIRHAESLITSAWSVAEVTCAFHRHFRQGSLNARQFQETMKIFRDHRHGGVWTLVPVADAEFMRMTETIATLPAKVFIRAGDAIQLASAVISGEIEVWSSDQRLVLAAPHFGLTGRTV